MIVGRIAHSEEQDRAAGGRSKRAIQFPDGRTALGSIEFRLTGQPHKHWYAYLRCKIGGRTLSWYVSTMIGETREEALRNAWSEALHKGMAAGRLAPAIRSRKERTNGTV
jgi:DNA mismatch endonuclease, patch repair protein